MGRGSRDAQGGRTSLVEDDLGDVGHFAANLVDEFAIGFAMRFTTHLPSHQQAFDARGSRAH